jgi:predicted dinucleotide-binding enzyme
VPAGVAIELAGSLSGTLSDATVVDPTNEYPDPGDERSVAERIAAAAPEATVVKCFNTIGAEHFTDPVVGGQTASMFLAGDAGDHRDAVETVAGDLGFDPVAVGDLDDAGHLEHLARLWIHLAGERGRDVAFRLIPE